MTISKTVVVATIAAVLLSANTARGENEKTTAQCAETFDQCILQCQTDHKGDAAKRAPCVAACSGKYAACDAGVAYDQAKPWLEDQAKKTKRFFDDLIEKYGDKKPAPDPQEKTKDNSI